MLFLASITKPYQLNHFLWLAIDIVIIVVGLILLKKKKVPLEKVLNGMLVVCVLSELVKTGYYEQVKEMANGNLTGYLDKTSLPFHLCSIQIFFLIGIKLTKSPTVKHYLYAFIYPTGVAGAIMSLLMPTISISFTSPLTYQYFLFHGLLILFGLYIVLSKEVEIHISDYLRNCGFLLIMFFLSIWVNSILSNPESNIYTNFMYSSRPPLQGLPILNMNHGWFGYVFALICLGIILMTVVHSPFIIKDLKNKKTKEETITQ